LSWHPVGMMIAYLQLRNFGSDSHTTKGSNE
jgi:hypothetical protein